MVIQGRLELPTLCLKGRYSTTELLDLVSLCSSKQFIPPFCVKGKMGKFGSVHAYLLSGKVLTSPWNYMLSVVFMLGHAHLTASITSE